MRKIELLEFMIDAKTNEQTKLAVLEVVAESENDPSYIDLIWVRKFIDRYQSNDVTF